MAFGVQKQVNWQLAIKHGHRNSWFTHEKVVILHSCAKVYQRVMHPKTQHANLGWHWMTLNAVICCPAPNSSTWQYQYSCDISRLLWNQKWSPGRLICNWDTFRTAWVAIRIPGSITRYSMKSHQPRWGLNMRHLENDAILGNDIISIISIIYQ